MLVVPFYGKMIKNTILEMYTRNVPKSHKLCFLSELGDFTRKKSVLVGFELFPQKELFCHKHELAVAVYGKNDEKHDFTHVYSKFTKNLINCGFEAYLAILQRKSKF